MNRGYISWNVLWVGANAWCYGRPTRNDYVNHDILLPFGLRKTIYILKNTLNARFSATSDQYLISAQHCSTSCITEVTVIDELFRSMSIQYIVRYICADSHFVMVTSSIESVFRVTGPLGGNPSVPVVRLTKASVVGLWCFVWCAPEQTI